MKNLICMLLAMVTLFVLPSCQDNRKARNYNSKTLVDGGGITFIKSGIEGGLTEIKAAKIAETNSKNPDIINFAKMMIADHTKAGDELKKIESDKYVTGGDTVSGDHQKMIAQLATKTGTDFDRLYIQTMVLDHEAAVRLFTEATNDKSATIKNFAAKTLPTLKMHLNSAKDICARLK